VLYAEDDARDNDKQRRNGDGPCSSRTSYEQDTNQKPINCDEK